MKLFAIGLLSEQHSEKKIREELLGLRPFIIRQLASQETQILRGEELVRYAKIPLNRPSRS